MERKQQVKQFAAKFTRFIGLQSYSKTWCCLGLEFWIKYPSHLLDTIFSAPMSQALGTFLLLCLWKGFMGVSTRLAAK